MKAVRTRVKICGMTRAEDVEASVAAGADALGFVFYAPSPRYLSVERAATLMARVPPFVTRVGLFVNATASEVTTHIEQLPLDVLQFHGDEDPEFCVSFGRPWIKVLRIKPGVDLLESTRRCAAQERCLGVLADTFSDQYGGTGKSFDWQLIPHGLPLPLVLSGGLNPGNVGAAIEAVQPWAVDVSSGVEGDVKGCKDAAKIEEFMRGVRNADARFAL